MCSTRNHDRVRAWGADHVVDYAQGDAATLQGLRAAAAAHGAFDLCLDTVRCECVGV